ncbi:MAG TPA: hypothetical protein VEH50_07195 [Methylomirabilota bacterium]|nr:hypothetical protein [Methylomirabilota bacterium]
MSPKLAKQSGFIGSGPVTYRLLGQPNAPSAIQLKVDYSAAPEPQNFYFSDYFRVVDLDPEILFVFGKRERPEGERLRNQLEIYFPAQQLVGQLWKSIPVFYKKLREFAEQKGLSPVRAGSADSVPEKAQVLRSNNAYMAQLGTEALIDFFDISLTNLLVATRAQRPIRIEALVRVSMSVNLLWGFLSECEPIAERMKAKYDVAGELYEEAVESN